MAKLLRHMAKFRYWKLTPEEMEKVDHDEDKVMNMKKVKEFSWSIQKRSMLQKILPN